MQRAAKAGAGPLFPVFVVVVVVVLVLVAVALAGCGRRGDRAAAGPPVVELDDIDAFLADAGGGGARAAARGQVVFIGIDGADWRFLEPLLATGELPNLRRLRDEGASGPLRSVYNCVSPPAWTAMMTGAEPERSGIYSFGKWNRAERDFASVSAGDVEVPPVWDVASYAGRRVAVLNVPMTYPAHAVNGIMISGFMTPNPGGERLDLDLAPPAMRREVPIDRRIPSHSPVGRTVLGDALNTFLVALYDTVDDGKQAYDTATVGIRSRRDSTAAFANGAVYPFRIGDYSPWLGIYAPRDAAIVDAWCKLTVAASDGDYVPRVSPTFYRVAAPYTYPDSLAGYLEREFGYYMPGKLMPRDMIPASARDGAACLRHFYRPDWNLFLYVFMQSDNIHHVEGFGARAREVYKVIDQAIGEVMDAMPRDATLVVASDHGFGAYELVVDLNRYLDDLGLLERLGSGEIDHERTVVFHNLWNLYFNPDLLTREELTRRGVEVPPGVSPRDALIAYLERRGRELTGPGGRPVPLEFARVAADAVGPAPDLLVKGVYDGYMIAYWNLLEPRPAVVSEATGKDRWNHAPIGIYLARGPGIRRGYRSGERAIADIAPTMLYQLGLPVTPSMQGRVMAEIFESAYLAANTEYAVGSYEPLASSPSSSPGDGEPRVREDLERKLRSLGYIH